MKEFGYTEQQMDQHAKHESASTVHIQGQAFSLPYGGGSSGKGKSPMADAQAEAETMLTEYRHALGDGIGADSERYELVCMHWLIGQKHVGLAYSIELQRAYLLFVDSARPQQDYMPLWLLDAAKELTLLMRTLVVPDQPSEQTVAWGGIERGPVISYRFKLVDAPTRIKF